MSTDIPAAIASQIKLIPHHIWSGSTHLAAVPKDLCNIIRNRYLQNVVYARTYSAANLAWAREFLRNRSAAALAAKYPELHISGNDMHATAYVEFYNAEVCITMYNLPSGRDFIDAAFQQSGATRIFLGKYTNVPPFRQAGLGISGYIGTLPCGIIIVTGEIRKRSSHAMARGARYAYHQREPYAAELHRANSAKNWNVACVTLPGGHVVIDDYGVVYEL